MTMSIRDRDLEESVLDGMARTLWVHAYISWATHTGHQLVGDSWEEMTPETPPAARMAADDIAKGIGFLNGFTRYPMVALLREDTPIHRSRHSPEDAEFAYRFGQRVALAALGGPGVQPTFSARIPKLRIALEDNGSALSWDGADATSNPSGARQIDVVNVGSRLHPVLEAHLPDGSTRRLGPDGRDFVLEVSPPGFRGIDVIDDRRPFSIVYGLPSGIDDLAENRMFIAKPSDMVNRGDIWGNELHDEHLRSVADGWDSGKSLPALDAFLAPSGRIYIEDGNHRLQIAARTDREIAIRIRDGSRYSPQRGARRIDGRIKAQLPRAAN